MNYNDLKYKYERVAFLKEMLKTDARWAIRGLLRIYEDQTAEEQAMGHTHVYNGVGFSGVDGEILSSFAEQIQKGRVMSVKQMALIHKKMPRYAGQLEKATHAKAETRKVGPSVNPIRHLRDMHRSQCD